MFYKISILLFFSLLSLCASETIDPPKGYSLNVELQETSILLGETTQLTLIYTYKDVEDYEIQEPKFSNFIVEELSSKDYELKDDWFVEEIHYSLKPLQEGNFTLTNISAQTQIIAGEYKNFDNRSKYTKIFSLTAKPITIEVKKLPNNITAIGNYRLSTTVDKKTADKEELVTLTISLYGDGNIQNLDMLKLSLKNATSYLLYTTKSKRQHLQTKVYEIIADQDYVVPAFELHYFDKESMSVQASLTEAINIHIQGFTQIQTKLTDNNEKYIFFFLGIVSILVILSLYKILKIKRVKKEPTLIKVIKSCSNASQLYKNCVVFLGKSKELDVLIYALEDESTLNFKTLKKEIIKELVKLGLHERNDLFLTTKDTL